MRTLSQILAEREEKKEKDKDVVFIETNPQDRFPNDTMSAIQKQINKNAKDLELDWKNAMELVNTSFDELDVPKPQAFLKNRWEQYQQLISYAVENLYDSRGLNGTWRTSI